MALEANYGTLEDSGKQFVPSERLYLTEDDRVVAEGDPDARWLFAVPGRPIPFAEAEAYGLVKEKPAQKSKTSTKTNKTKSGK